MVDEAINTEADNSQPKKELSPGEMLLQARLDAGLTQEQVAKDLYMTVYKVKALETDDYKRLNSDTFARGYIRAYANLVKLDVVAVLAAYDKLMDELRPQPVLQKQAVAAETNHHRGAWQFLVVIAAFFLGLWLISVWFFDNRNDSQYEVVTENISAMSVQKKSVEDASETTLVTSEASSNSVSASSVSAAEIAKPGVAVVGANASSAGSPSQASAGPVVASSLQAINSSVQNSTANNKKTTLDELSFSFRAESWLEVSDSRGDVLATELQPAGSKLRLVGMAPFDVKLGNAPVVDIQLNGKKIDVVPLMGSNVLIMKIGN